MANPILSIEQFLELVPGLALDTTTRPTATQAQGLIDTVASEMRAMLAGLGVAWPADPDTDTAQFLRQTLVEGAKEQILRAKYIFERGDRVPDELDRAADAYKQRMGMLKTVANNLRTLPDVATGSDGITVAPATEYPTLTGSFGQYTGARDALDSVRNRTYRPYR